MANSISDTLLSQISNFVAAQIGLHFPMERWADLERGIRSAANELGFKKAESCVQWLVSSPVTKKQIEILANHLTIGETYFFRGKKNFEIFEKRIFPELIRSRRGNEQHLKIWSAGCSTGEEPYSIAILLSKIIPDLNDWNVTILGTDINHNFLQKASEGVYREWSFRDTPPGIKERYFKRTKDGQFEIIPHIKKMVKFSYLNLVEDTYPSLLSNTSTIDIIFCRNVLMYFAPEQAKKVIQYLYHSLVDGGWLIVSPGETSHVLYPQFIAVNFPGAIFYKKDSQKSTTVETFRPKKSQSYALHKKTMAPFQPSEGKLVSSDFNRYKRTTAGVTAKDKQTAEVATPKDLPPDDPKAIALLARTYANQGKLAEALEWCEKAIALDKLVPGLYYLRATILQEQGQLEEAVMSLKRALYLEQNFVLAHFALGNLTRQQGKFNESDKHFENALSILSVQQQEYVLPESEGMTVGRLMEIIRSTISA